MIDFASYKKHFLFSLVGAVIIAAVVAVVTVLVGEFNEVFAKVLFTLLMVVVHSLISLFFIWDDSRQHTFEKFGFFSNTLFLMIILSFITSIFGIWDLFSDNLVSNLYQNYFLFIFSALHLNVLSKALGKEGYLDKIVYSNYAFVVIVALMLLPSIYVTNAFEVLGEMYYRILGAVGIVDGTLSVLTIIFYKVYLHKHPEVQKKKKSSGWSWWNVIVVLLAAYFLYLVFWAIAMLFFVSW